MVEMRRASAILLLFLFNFSLIAPALFAGAESNLPACCRRNGNHHCGMAGGAGPTMVEAPSSGPAFNALRLRCPFFPDRAVVPESGPALLTVSPASPVSVIIQIADEAQAEAGYRITLRYSHQKRGPPALFS
jgi:hypothetical protein